ncbi:MAG: DUF1700 domain-containing protein [Clostridiales Family XIII bacterium]|jgi:uncharacterized membrane protein|nr:DUF1700 domain-containing protein [Clostridiales Family XIII bacterium]
MADNIYRYIQELERALTVNEYDKQEAINYYKEYFSDADIIDYDEAVKRLGTPWQVAAQIRADIAMERVHGATPPQQERDKANAEKAHGIQTNPQKTQQNTQQKHQSYGQQAKEQHYAQYHERKRNAGVVWAVVLGILALPVGLPILISVLAVMFSICIVIFAVLLSLAVSGIAVCVSGLAIAVIGAIVLPQSIATGLFMIGSGLACIGLGILLSIATFYLSKYSGKGIAYLFNSIRLSLKNRSDRKRQQRLNEELYQHYNSESGRR